MYVYELSWYVDEQKRCGFDIKHRMAMNAQITQSNTYVHADAMPFGRIRAICPEQGNIALVVPRCWVHNRDAICMRVGVCWCCFVSAIRQRSVVVVADDEHEPVAIWVLHNGRIVVEWAEDFTQFLERASVLRGLCEDHCACRRPLTETASIRELCGVQNISFAALSGGQVLHRSPPARRGAVGVVQHKS